MASNDIEGLANTTVDDLVEFLDVSLDEAEQMLAAAQSVIAMRDQNRQPSDDETEGEGQMEQHAASIEEDPNARPATSNQRRDDCSRL
jgi:hypothetical protein